MNTWWLSFCDLDRPTGQQFLGVALVEAPTLRAAIARAWATGCNPGGEIGSSLIPVDELDDDRRTLLADTPFDTLMDRAELKRRGLAG